MEKVQRSAPSLKTEYLYPGVKAITNQFTDKLTGNWMGSLFGENDDFGQAMGNIFSNGITSVSDTFTKNLVKGDSLTAGLGKNVGTTLGGVGAGVAGNLLGKGITSLGGNTALSRGLGQGISTAVGSLGGSVLSNIIQGKNAFQGFRTAKDGLAAAKALSTASNVDKMGAAAKASKLAAANLAGLGMSVVGSGLQAAIGPSKEYGGRYGHITQGMDTAYDLINAGATFVPGVGTVISGAMTLNKGLSNLFGSTDGMTRTDAILGSAFMPAPVKWVNMWGSSKTGTFNNQSWQNDEKATSFMGNAFGNLNDRFKRAREEAGKTYGTFSQGAKREAQDNIDFANKAWAQIMNMADENELAKIRSQYMTSINNQRYAQNIQGGFSPVSFGRMGMKLLNNSIPHEVGQRLLSGAALINSGQQILSASVVTLYNTNK